MDDKFENSDSWANSETKLKSQESLSQETYHLKLWIGTVKNLQQYQSDNKTAIFGHKIIAHVDILGTVVDKLSYEKADIYVCKCEIITFFHPVLGCLSVIFLLQ